MGALQCVLCRRGHARIIDAVQPDLSVRHCDLLTGGNDCGAQLELANEQYDSMSVRLICLVTSADVHGKPLACRARVVGAGSRSCRAASDVRGCGSGWVGGHLDGGTAAGWEHHRFWR